MTDLHDTIATLTLSVWHKPGQHISVKIYGTAARATGRRTARSRQLKGRLSQPVKRTWQSWLEGAG